MLCQCYPSANSNTIASGKQTTQQLYKTTTPRQLDTTTDFLL